MYLSCVGCAGVLLDRAAREEVTHLAGNAGGSPASLSALLGSFSIPYRNRLGDVARTHRFKWSPWGGEQHNHQCHLWGRCMLLFQKETFPCFPTSKDGFLLLCSMWVFLWLQNKKLALQVFSYKSFIFPAPIYIRETWRFKTYFFSSFEPCVHSANMAELNRYFYSVVKCSFSPRQNCYFRECQYIFISAALKMLFMLFFPM